MSREQIVAEQLREIAAFLDGSGEFNGCWFGEAPDGAEGRPIRYWWRAALRERVDAAIAALTASPQAAPEGVVAHPLNATGVAAHEAPVCETQAASPQVQGGEQSHCPHCGVQPWPQRAPGVDEAARALIDTIDNECESVTSPKVWEAKERLEAALASGPSGVDECDHEWVDARNRYVQSGELCLKCHAIRAAQDQGEGNGL